MKKCMACNKVSEDSVLFCTQCGSNSFEPVSEQADRKNEDDKAVQDKKTLKEQERAAKEQEKAEKELAKAEKQQKKAAKELEKAEKANAKAQKAHAKAQKKAGKIVESEKRMSIPARIGSVLLSILLVAMILICSVAFIAKNAFSEKALGETVTVVAEDLTELEIGALVDAKDEDATIAEYVHSLLPEREQEMVSEKDIEKLLEEEFVTKFVEDTVNDYVSDAVSNNGDGEINTKALLRLIEDNKETIEKRTGYRMVDMDFDYIEGVLEDADLEQYEVASFEKDNALYFTVFRLTHSIAVYVILLLIIVLMIVWIIVVCKDKKYAFTCVGVDFIVSGSLIGILVVLTYILGSKIKDVLDMGVDITDHLLGPVRQYGWIEAGGLLGAGILIVVIVSIIKAICKKKAK